jgi:hypothetical protein
MKPIFTCCKTGLIVRVHYISCKPAIPETMFRIFSKKPLSELSLVELKSQEQLAQTWYRLSAVFVLGLFAFVAFWTSYKGYHATNIIFVGSLAVLPAFVVDKLKKIRTEISSRG